MWDYDAWLVKKRASESHKHTVERGKRFAKDHPIRTEDERAIEMLKRREAESETTAAKQQIVSLLKSALPETTALAESREGIVNRGMSVSRNAEGAGFLAILKLSVTEAFTPQEGEDAVPVGHYCVFAGGETMLHAVAKLELDLAAGKADLRDDKFAPKPAVARGGKAPKGRISTE